VVEATLDEGVLIAGGAKAIEASLPLTPLFNRRIVGALVPLLIDLEKPPEARPVGLELGAFRLPLDGDLTKLDGSVRLDLGQVAYQLLPGLDSVLKLAGVEQAGKRLATLDPIAIRIDRGVARYDALPLVVEGQKLLFKGSYDLTSSEFDLSVDVPLKLLGGSLERELKEVSEFLGPDLAVPLRLAGTWKRPRVSIGEGFVEKALKEAGKRALGKGLLDLLKKKDD
jgi:hypothetical protein